MKFPQKNQWQSFFDILNLREKLLFLTFSFLFFFSLGALIFHLYLEKTIVVPKEGGVIVEGLFGEVRILNPLLANSEAERDIIYLIFEPLFEIENGKLVPRLGESLEILEDGKVIKLNLKENIFWEDGKEITADDVLFTVQLIQNPETKSWLRNKWLGVEVEKVSEKTLLFKLKAPSVIFLENLNLRIVPKHYLENISPANLLFNPKSFLPLSSGPFRVEKILNEKDGRIKFVILKRNEKYFEKEPYLKRVIFALFEDEKEILREAKNKKIDSFLTDQKLNEISNFREERLNLPRYFSLFLNFNSEILKEKEIRKAISFSINKERILKEVFSGEGKIVSSPFNENLKDEYSPEKAKEILEKEGFFREGEMMVKIVKKESNFSFSKDLKVGDRGDEVKELQKCLAKFEDIYPQGEITGYFGNETKKAVMKFQEKFKEEILEKEGIKQPTGKVGALTRKKLNEVCFEREEKRIELKVKLVTGEDEILKEIAQKIKEDLENVGFSVELSFKPLSEFEREVIFQKNYDLLLFGQFFGKMRDPYPFFHSSQIENGGLNLANFSHKEADEILVTQRESFDEEKRKEMQKKLGEILFEEKPVIFLIEPSLFYFLSPKINGKIPHKIEETSQRFLYIKEWYLKTKRIFQW